MYKVCITASNVSDISKVPVELLKNNGFDVKEKSFSSMKNKEELIEFVKDSDALILASVEKFDEEILKHIPNLKIIARRGVGFDNVDIDYCHKNNIIVTRALGTVESAVSELTLAYMLAFNRKLNLHSKELHEGIWQKHISTGLKGATLGLVGCGHIGSEVVRKASAFDMNILYTCPHRKIDLENKYNIKYVSFDVLIKTSDFISLHLPATEETINMFTINEFKKMKKSAYFINTARGSIVNEEDLTRALKENLIAGAALDVFKNEPFKDSPFCSIENITMTPHVGTFTHNTFYDMNLLCAENIINFFNNTLDDKYRV